MSLRLPSVTALIAAAFLQPACATSPMTSQCTISGPAAALPGMSEAAICDRFEADLARALGDRPVPEGLTIALTLHKRGAIDAELSLPGARWPRVSVDALDRGLRAEDVSRLARAAAQMLVQQESTRISRDTAQHNGE